MIKNLRPKLCEQGKIKIGRLGDERKTKDGKSSYRLPTKIDHFIITTTERDQTGNFTPNVSLMEEIAEAVNEPADHLTTIPVYLLFDDIDSNFYTTYNCYQGKTRICTGDGETATLLKTGEEISCPCPRLEQDYKGNTPCKPYGRLNVVLQSMNMIGGAWVYRTTGWNSVSDILGSLMLIKRVAGRLSGIPLTMKLFPKTTMLPRGPVTVYTVSLVFTGSAFALAETAKRCPMIGHDETLSPDQTIEIGEEAEIQEEFYPPAESEEEKAADITEQVQKKKKKSAPEEKTAAELARENKIQKTKTPAPAPAIEEKPEEEPEEEPDIEFHESPIDTAMKTAKEEKTKATRDKVKAKSQALAAAKKKKAEAKLAAAPAEKVVEEEPPREEPPIEEGEALDEPAEDFGWV